MRPGGQAIVTLLFERVFESGNLERDPVTPADPCGPVTP